MGFIAVALLCPSFANGASRSEIRRALHATILQKLEFESTPMEEAIGSVIDRVRIAHPNLKKVKILYRSPFTGKNDTAYRPRFSLKLHDIPADIALLYIGQQTGRRFSVADEIIYVYPITWYDEEPEEQKARELPF